MSKWRQKVEKVKYIFIDEVSMISCFDLYKISAQLAQLRNETDEPFGGLNMIFAGDFAQLPPVGKSISLYGRVNDSSTVNGQKTAIGKSIMASNYYCGHFTWEHETKIADREWYQIQNCSWKHEVQKLHNRWHRIFAKHWLPPFQWCKNYRMIDLEMYLLSLHKMSIETALMSLVANDLQQTVDKNLYHFIPKTLGLGVLKV